METDLLTYPQSGSRLANSLLHVFSGSIKCFFDKKKKKKKVRVGLLTYSQRESTLDNSFLHVLSGRKLAAIYIYIYFILFLIYIII